MKLHNLAPNVGLKKDFEHLSVDDKERRKTRIRRCRRSIIRGNIRRIRMEYGGI